MLEKKKELGERIELLCTCCAPPGDVITVWNNYALSQKVYDLHRCLTLSQSYTYPTASSFNK